MILAYKKTTNNMGFTKKIISKESIKYVANSDNYETFFKYFKANAILSEDMFSMNIFKKIEKLTIQDKNEIIEIMNECK